jgi:sugar (pentulose or hexulose) kinase
VLALTGQGISVGWGVVAGRLCVLAGLSTGMTLNRIAAMLGVTTAAARAELAARAHALPAAHPTLRLTDARGERFAITGVTDGVTPEVLWRTAVDALAAESAHVLARIDALSNPYRKIVVGGGWLHDPALRAAKRRQFPALRETGVAEPGAYGAALLAGVAAGHPVGRSPAWP